MKSHTTIQPRADAQLARERYAAVIALIDDLAAQANLLATNAAVEAAHPTPERQRIERFAGEVRHFADRVNAAASEVAEELHAGRHAF